MAKLIAYYSRAGENYFGGAYKHIAVGNTEKAAQMIAEITGGDLFKIEQAQPYSENYQACIAEARRDLQAHARPEVLNLPDNLGYPNYWGTMPMAVYTFLERYDLTGKTVHPFCTHEGSGLSGTEGDIRRAAKGAAISRRGWPSTAAAWTARGPQSRNGLRDKRIHTQKNRLFISGETAFFPCGYSSTSSWSFTVWMG